MNTTGLHSIEVRLEAKKCDTPRNVSSSDGPMPTMVGFWVEALNQLHFVEWFVNKCGSPNKATIYRLPSDSNRCRFFVHWTDSPISTGSSSNPGLSCHGSYDQAKESCLIAISMHALQPNFWIPNNARLSPTPRKSDWPALLQQGVMHVWHPGIGLYKMQTESAIRLETLIGLPCAVAVNNWSKAVERANCPERLISVQARPVDNLDDWFQTSAGDIGKDSEDLNSLQPSKSEMLNAPVQRAAIATSAVAAVALAGIAGAASKLVAMAKSVFVGNRNRNDFSSANPGHPRKHGSNALDGNAWMDSIRNWAKARVDALNALIESRRNSAIHRLMEMLERDPDEGLRHAIPMADDVTRGISPPGTDLVSQDLRWSHGWARCGSDPWMLELKVRNQLRKKYLELAIRERRMGRFERAAYIYARLLNDYATAAIVLEEGKFFREAATVYSTRLHNSIKAAECFRKAGDFDEAIRLYRKQEAFLESANILLELGQLFEAQQDLRLHVQFCCQRRRWAEAADCLIERLDATEEALELLRSQWPLGLDSEACFGKTIEILKQTDQNMRIVEQIARLTKEERIFTETAWPMDWLVALSSEKNNRAIVTAARQSAIRISGRLLKSGQPIEVSRALSALRCIEPDDLVLKRDTHRFHRDFLAIKSEPRVEKKRVSKSASSAKMTAVFQEEIENDVRWLTLFATTNGVVAVGELDLDLVIKTCSRNECDEFEVLDSEYRLRNCLAPLPIRRWVRCCVDPNRADHVSTIFVAGCRVPGDFKFGPDVLQLGPSQLQIVWSSGDVADVVPWETTTDVEYVRTSYIRMTANDFELRSLTTSLSSEHLADLLPKFAGTESQDSIFVISPDVVPFGSDDTYIVQDSDWRAKQPRLAETATYWFVGWGRELQVFNGGGIEFADSLASPIVALIPSPPHAKNNIIVVTKTEVSIQWLRTDGWRRQAIATDLLDPCCLLLRDGRLVVGHSKGIQVYSNQDHLSQLIAEKSSISPIECLCLDCDPNHFWSIDQSGLLVRWSVY